MTSAGSMSIESGDLLVSSFQGPLQGGRMSRLTLHDRVPRFARVIPGDGSHPSQAEGTLVEVSPESAGRYLLLGLIGSGSMGEVWRAEDPQIGRLVAVKLLNLP